MTKLKRVTFGFLFFCSTLLAWNSDAKPLEGVRPFDINEYLGMWYEIATIEMRFQRGCTCTQAEYSLREDGMIRVSNSCRKGPPGAKISRAEGKARFATDDRSVGNLEVSFFWIFYGDYRVVHWSEDRTWVIVSDRDAENFWLLSRVPVMNEQLVSQAFEVASRLGIDVNKATRTSREACP